ncbi:MAG TPA: hypothetical protein VL326_25280 [Kofleriaceae bacterium]|nr:hypothetical protein [Kofleriaceae bacterium]
MGRAWLVAALVVGGLSTEAHAKRIECQCPQTQTFPTYDEQDVPTNARAIELTPFDRENGIKITSLGDLAPDTDYHNDQNSSLTFHTGKGPDVRPPATPTEVHPSIVIRTAKTDVDKLADQTTISMFGSYDDDTRILEIEVTDSAGNKAHFGLGVWNPYMCGLPLHLVPGHATIKVWALDRAANRSAEPWTGDVTITAVDADPSDGWCSSHHHVRCGMGSALLFIMVVPAGFILLLIGLAIAGAIRRSRIRYTVGEHVSIPLGESVARIVAKTYVIKFFVSVGVIAALWQLEHEIVAILLAPLPILWFLDVLRAAAVVRRFNHPVNRLERKDDYLLVDHTLLYCGRRAFNRASRLPTATVPKR